MNLKHIILLGIAAFAFTCGAVRQYFFPGAVQTPFDVWFALFLAFFVFFWYLVDSNQRSYHRPPMLSIGVVALAVVALPCYFFLSRGAKAGLVAIGLFVLASLGFILVNWVGGYATYYVLQS